MTYKPLNENDVVSTRTLLHEAIPLTGTIVSGTYDDNNIKNYTHGMFQSVYDYPYLSSSANHIFDITIGLSSVGSNLFDSTTVQAVKKKNIYNQMAQVLMGYDATGSILRFDEDGNLLDGGRKVNNVFFLNFSRLLVKDEIKKGTFELELGIDDAYAQNGAVFNNRIKITDYSASLASPSYLVNSPAGEYGILSATGSKGTDVTGLAQRYSVGLIFYQAGIAVISGSVFNDTALGGILNNTLNSTNLSSTSGPSGFQFVSGSEISSSADAIRNRIYNLQFNNTTELNSTVYFCRANHNEFNYSSNPTYVSGSKIRVKSQSTDNPVSYITTVGLYNDNNELMATAKLSEPLKKSPDTEFTIRARLDY
tara:strand:- start:3842 stop:4939 length:1098 start_codon:yes stop_codon:yes gene_type:complete